MAFPSLLGGVTVLLRATEICASAVWPKTDPSAHKSTVTAQRSGQKWRGPYMMLASICFRAATTPARFSRMPGRVSGPELERELGGDLHDTWAARRGNHSEVTPLVHSINDQGQSLIDRVARIDELRVVEDVKRLKAQLQNLGLRKIGVLEQGHVPV